MWTIVSLYASAPLAEGTLIILLNYGREVLTEEQMRWWLLQTNVDGRSVLHFYAGKEYLGAETLEKLLCWGKAYLGDMVQWLLKRNDDGWTVLQYSVADREKEYVPQEFGRACLTRTQLEDWYSEGTK
mmetsp:Transcript_36572/g.146179  ORF Transcript_36572/g.146179 Transcript_36572/m.146179 type:complete len:128 (-) Transcript_36572:841-1224(-)